MARAKGSVTLEGKPLVEGQISFDGQDGTPPVTVAIRNGTYELTVRPGKKVVRITATRLVKPNVPGMPEMNEPVPQNYLPARYNSESKLAVVVSESGDNEFKFEIASK